MEDAQAARAREQVARDRNVALAAVDQDVIDQVKAGAPIVDHNGRLFQMVQLGHTSGGHTIVRIHPKVRGKAARRADKAARARARGKP